MNQKQIALTMTKNLRRIQQVEGALMNTINRLIAEKEKLREIAEIRQTGWFVLLNRDGDGWKAVAIVNPDTTGSQPGKEMGPKTQASCGP
jgi:fructose-1,6-bisphosphatase/sedoheptulose 1,7-bisphosphatase-like protein